MIEPLLTDVALADAEFGRSEQPRSAGRKLAHRCPNCSSIIYSRKNKLCGVCGDPLPESLLFTPAEANRLTRLLDIERQRHRQWMSRRLDQAVTAPIFL